MKNNIIIVGLVSFLLLASIASAGSLNVTIYTNKNLAHVVMSSSIEMIFKYPKNSIFSTMLENTSKTFSFTVNYSGPSQKYIAFLEGFFKSHYKNVTIENLTINFLYTMHANSTEMIGYRNVSMDLWLTGIFNKSKSNSVVNLSWRDIEINRNFNITYENKQFDINGLNENNSMIENISSKFGINSQYMANYKIPKIWAFNYSMFSKPLKDWKREYNKTLNETIFSLSFPPQVLYNQTFTISNSSFGGMPFMNNFTKNMTGTYTFEIIADPIAYIAVPGYAVPNNNTVTIYSSPSSTSTQTQTSMPLIYIIIIIVVIIAIVGGAMFYLNSKKSKENKQ